MYRNGKDDEYSNCGGGQENKEKNVEGGDKEHNEGMDRGYDYDNNRQNSKDINHTQREEEVDEARYGSKNDMRKQRTSLCQHIREGERDGEGGEIKKKQKTTK